MVFHCWGRIFVSSRLQMAWLIRTRRSMHGIGAAPARVLHHHRLNQKHIIRDSVFLGVFLDNRLIGFHLLTDRQNLRAIFVTCKHHSGETHDNQYDHQNQNCSTASGAERAYKAAVRRMAQYLIEDGLFHLVQLKRKSQKKRKQKIAAATYLYQADCDGEWGEIQFDFQEKTAQIIQLADWDLMISQPFAKYAISYLLNCQKENLPKEAVISFDEQ